MPGLFVKIFIWFWATVVLTCLSLVLAFALQPHGVPSRWHSSLEDATKYYGTAAVGVLNQRVQVHWPAFRRCTRTRLSFR
jgi:hypothetical protein